MNCAIYIDADNVSYKSVEEILARANNCNVIIKKIYADWTHESMKRWAVKAKKYGFQGIQCFGNERKQTSDVYMVTDIINDLYNNKFIEMVILATSDIDFTHLCHIIKQKNKKLVIFTPQKSNISNLVTESESSIENKKSLENKKNHKTNKVESPIPTKKVKPNILIDSNLLKDSNLSKDSEDKFLPYLVQAMKDSLSIYISKYKKNLRKVVPKNIKGIDINHIDKLLFKYPKYFKLVKKGNKIKIYGLFHLHSYSKSDFLKEQKMIENKYQDIFKVFKYQEIFASIYE